MIPPEELASVFVWGGGGECGCVRVGVCVTVCVFMCVYAGCVCVTLDHQIVPCYINTPTFISQSHLLWIPKSFHILCNAKL